MSQQNVISEELNIVLQKEKASKQLDKAKSAEQIKLESGNWAYVQIDAKTKVLRKIK